MSLRSRLIKWFSKDEGVRLAIFEDFKTGIQGVLKNELMMVLSDEEIAKSVTGYGDALYDRYHSKFTGWLGGTGKGVNSLITGISKNSNGNGTNPLLDIVNGMDGKDFSFASMLKLFLSGAMNQKPNSNNSNNFGNQNVGMMT